MPRNPSMKRYRGVLSWLASVTTSFCRERSLLGRLILFSTGFGRAFIGGDLFGLERRTLIVGVDNPLLHGGAEARQGDLVLGLFGGREILDFVRIGLEIVEFF